MPSSLRPTIVVIAGSLFAAGCIILPTPQEFWHSGQHEGVVLDADSGAPLEGVIVRLQRVPDISTVSDAAGHFSLGPVLRNSKVVLLLAPSETACIDILNVEHPGFRPEVLRKESLYPESGNCQGVHFYSEVRMTRVPSNLDLNGDAPKGFDLSPVALQRRTTFCEPPYVHVVSQMRIPQRYTLPLCHFADLRGLTC